MMLSSFQFSCASLATGERSCAPAFILIIQACRQFNNRIKPLPAVNGWMGLGVVPVLVPAGYYWIAAQCGKFRRIRDVRMSTGGAYYLAIQRMGTASGLVIRRVRPNTETLFLKQITASSPGYTTMTPHGLRLRLQAPGQQPARRAPPSQPRRPNAPRMYSERPRLRRTRNNSNYAIFCSMFNCPASAQK